MVQALPEEKADAATEARAQLVVFDEGWHPLPVIPSILPGHFPAKLVMAGTALQVKATKFRRYELFGLLAEREADHVDHSGRN